MFQFRCILFFLFIWQSSATAQTRPNIIYIMADDLGYADLSCYGRRDYTTPHLDKLASESMRFTQAYAGSAVCTPTRASFMTGRYPARIPVGLFEPLAWVHHDSTIGLTPEYPSLPALLKNNGYETFLVGKWHLGFMPSFSPLRNGFDEFFGFHGGGVDYISHTSPGLAPDLYENDQPVQRSGYLTQVLAERAIDIIRRPRVKPFFLSIMLNAPHWPWQGPDSPPYPRGVDHWKKHGSHEIFASMVKSMDSAIGQVMKTLDEAGLSANTLVIFTSDNGGEMYSDMGPLSGSKQQLREGGIRVPAFVRWPGKITPNSSTDQVAITMDWTATILNLAKARPDPGFPPDGMDLLPVLTGQKQPVPRSLYWRLFQRTKQHAARDGNWKYVKDESGEYLFDLSTDLAEKIDLKEKHPDIFQDLKTKFRDWEKTVLPPVPMVR